MTVHVPLHYCKIMPFITEVPFAKMHDTEVPFSTDHDTTLPLLTDHDVEV